MPKQNPVIRVPVNAKMKAVRRQSTPAAAHELDSSFQKSRLDQTSVLRGLIEKVTQSSRSLRLGVRLGIARKEPEHEDAEEKEDDRVNGDLEGEHGDRPASVTRASSYGA